MQPHCGSRVCIHGRGSIYIACKLIYDAVTRQSLVSDIINVHILYNINSYLSEARSDSAANTNCDEDIPSDDPVKELSLPEKRPRPGKRPYSSDNESVDSGQGILIYSILKTIVWYTKGFLKKNSLMFGTWQRILQRNLLQ